MFEGISLFMFNICPIISSGEMCRGEIAESNNIFKTISKTFEKLYKCVVLLEVPKNVHFISL